MKVQGLLLSILVFYGCSERSLSQMQKSYSTEDCLIVEVIDSTVHHIKSTIGLKFVCDDSIEVKQINFLDENPWKNVEFPILKFENPYLKFSNKDHYDRSYKEGGINFDVLGFDFSQVESKFNFSTHISPSNYIPNFVRTSCRYKLYQPHYGVLYYSLMVFGISDTLTVRSEPLHIESKLKVYGASGEIAYEFETKDYCNGLKLDSTYRLLFLSTWRPDHNKRITGIEIRDIRGDSIWAKFELDTGLDVSEPDLYGNFAVYTVYKHYSDSQNDRDPYHVLVFDISSKQLMKKELEKNYLSQFYGISNHSLIYMSGGNESEYEELYDTIPIIDMEVVELPWQGSIYR